MTRSDLPAGYGSFVEALKTRIRDAQVKAALAVNRELLTLYWNIGRSIIERQEAEAWGGGVLDRLADDLQKAFPGVSGFSRANVYRMRAFYLAYPLENSGSEIVAQAVRQFAETLPDTVADLPWGHHVVLLQKVKEPDDRAWYAKVAVAYGWSRAVLTMQIDTRLHEREGKAVTNFPQTLPPAQSDLAQQTLAERASLRFRRTAGIEAPLGFDPCLAPEERAAAVGALLHGSLVEGEDVLEQHARAWSTPTTATPAAMPGPPREGAARAHAGG